MKTLFLVIFSVFFANAAIAQADSEIFLFDLSAKKDKVTISNPVNITNHKGYDNQPSFHPDLPLIYYSSFNDDGRSDIRSYDYKSKQTKSITETSEREYSPTVTLEKQYLSCIIQRDNGAQNLGKYPIDGGEPVVIIDNFKVGYHAWGDNSHLALFVLGDEANGDKPGTPHTLHYVLLPMKKDTILAQNIGRSLHRVPGEASISFVHKVSDNNWVIKKFDTRTLKVSDIGPAVTGHEDLAWLPDGKILMSDGPKIFFMNPTEGPGWTEVVVSGTHVLKGTTRLAVSSNGKKLAVVVTE
jgi:hypothetical protein